MLSKYLTRSAERKLHVYRSRKGPSIFFIWDFGHLGIAHFIGTSIWDASYKSGLRTKWCGNMNAEASILSILPSLVTFVGLTLFLLRKSKMGEMVDENRDDSVCM